MSIEFLDDIVCLRIWNPQCTAISWYTEWDMFVLMFNLNGYFEDVTIKLALKRISHLHHFHFTSSRQGVCLGQIDNTEKYINLLKTSWAVGTIILWPSQSHYTSLAFIGKQGQRKQFYSGTALGMMSMTQGVARIFKRVSEILVAVLRHEDLGLKNHCIHDTLVKSQMFHQ